MEFNTEDQSLASHIFFYALMYNPCVCLAYIDKILEFLVNSFFFLSENVFLSNPYQSEFDETHVLGLVFTEILNKVQFWYWSYLKLSY